MARKAKPIPLTFRQMLDAAQIGVRRELPWHEAHGAMPGYSESIAAAELNDGQILVCRTESGFGGSDVTPPDPIEVAFYLLPASPSSEERE